MSYTAANGQEIDDEMIDRWCEAYEQGDFPSGEHTVGEVVMGRPKLSAEKTTTLTIKLPVGMKAALNRKAKIKGMTMSNYLRSLIADDAMTI